MKLCYPYLAMMEKGRELSDHELKEEGVRILEEVLRVSEELGIQPYMAYGSLLGTIRHKGFIPWDDDIDIWMFRKDFELFKLRFDEICSTDFKLIGPETDSSYTFLMPKVVSLRTEAREKNLKPIKDYGVFLDVFVLDYVDVNNPRLEELRTLEHRRRVSTFRNSLILQRLFFIYYALKHKETRLKDLWADTADILHQIDSICSSYPQGPVLRNDGSLQSFHQYFMAEDFASVIEMPFEGLMVPVPCGYDRLLRDHYGDYMTPPPEKDRKQARHLTYCRWR